MNSVQMDPSQWQLGKTKVFIKAPESLFLLEEVRERKYHDYAKKIQRAYRRYRARKYYLECKKQSLSLFYGKKERRRFTLNRDYLGDYISYLDNPYLRSLVGKNEKVLFCDVVKKYDRRFKPKEMDLFITENYVILIGLEKITEGPKKGQYEKEVKRKLQLNQIESISISALCDDFFVMHIPSEFDNVFECVFKTELVSVLNEVYQRKMSRPLTLNFTNKYVLAR
jgi:myosin-1